MGQSRSFIAQVAQAAEISPFGSGLREERIGGLRYCAHALLFVRGRFAERAGLTQVIEVTGRFELRLICEVDFDRQNTVRFHLTVVRRDPARWGYCIKNEG